MDRRCRVCLHEIHRARAPCPECGADMPLHGWVPDGLFGTSRLPLAQSPVRAWLVHQCSRVPDWLAVPLLLLGGAVVTVGAIAIAVRLLP